MAKINMLDLATEFRLFEDEVRTAVSTVLESQQFINGPAIGELETAMAQRVGVRHAVAISNGTDAILCALMALGIGPGDEVAVPAFTFFATAGSVARTGATPVFVDVDPETFNMDPESLERAVTPRTRAVMPVHLYGQCADMDAITSIARRHGLKVIEDAAQAIGATYGGRQACALGDMACMSFYPTKNLGGFGEGGMIFTDDDVLGGLCRQLRSHGESSRYVHERVGGNFRLDTMKAAILLVKLRYLDDFTARRRRAAAHYDAALAELSNGETGVRTPLVADGCVHVYHQYTLRCADRDGLQRFLASRDVGSTVYYPVPLHLQPCFANLGYKAGRLPVAETLCREVLSIPCHPMLSDEDHDHVASAVRAYAGASSSPRASVPN